MLVTVALPEPASIAKNSWMVGRRYRKEISPASLESEVHGLRNLPVVEQAPDAARAHGGSAHMRRRPGQVLSRPLQQFEPTRERS